MIKLKTEIDHKIFEKAIFIRKFEERLLSLFDEGKLNGTVHTCIGQEIIPVVLETFLEKDDFVFSNHRGHGHYLARGGSAKDLLLEIMGDTSGVSGGIGGSQHIMTNNFLSNGIQGGLAPIATGFAFGQKTKKTNKIAVSYIGDGTLGEGQLYEAMTLASLFKCPLLFILENNGYAQSTGHKDVFNGSVEKRIEGFGLKYLQTNSWDIENLKETLKTGVQNARNQLPTCVEIETYRLKSHSKGDDNRAIAEINDMIEKDTVNKYISDFPDKAKLSIKSAKDKLHKIISTADKKNTEHVDENQLVINESVSFGKIDFTKTPKQRYNKLIGLSISCCLEKKDAILIGEDICDTGPSTPIKYGGAFKVTDGLSTKFPNQVFNTTISEAGICGFIIGSSLSKVYSIGEIMFGDFMTLCFDQLTQQASKIPQMFGKEVRIPFILRTPMGARRGYGPTHSQNIEKSFLFMPNINVFSLNCLVDASKIFQQIFDSKKNGSIVIEDKVSYTHYPVSSPVEGFDFFESSEEFKTFFIEPNFAKANLFIFTYGAMLQEIISSLDLLVEEEIFPKILCYTQLSPFNSGPLLQKFKKSDILVTLEEGSRYGSISSEIVAILVENNSPPRKLIRISNDSIIPCSKELEIKQVPNRENLVAQIRKGLFDA